MVRLETPIDEEGSAETELRSPPNLCTGVLVTMKVRGIKPFSLTFFIRKYLPLASVKLKMS